MPKVARLEVISVGARRHWALEEKQRIVAESYAAPRQVSATARRNGLSASQLFTWRRLARDGRLSDDEMTFASAVIGDASSSGNRSFLPDQSAAADRSLPPQASATAKSGRIEIVLQVDIGSLSTIALMQRRWRGFSRCWSGHDLGAE
jgi:transposase